MPKENHRKSPRRLRSHQAWMTFAEKSRGHDCRVLEISRDGAKLLADVVAPIGTIIHLSADQDDPVRKKCEVVWQKNRILGVKFV